ERPDFDRLLEDERQVAPGEEAVALDREERADEEQRDERPEGRDAEEPRQERRPRLGLGHLVFGDEWRRLDHVDSQRSGPTLKRQRGWRQDGRRRIERRP